MYTIYIVDDEEWVVSLLRNIIPWRKHECTLIGSSTEVPKALHQIRALKPDIVLTDISMPAMSGLEMIEQLGGTNAHSEFIIITGHDEFEFARTAVREGVSAYLLKPVDEEELIAVINDLKLRIRNRRDHDSARIEERRHIKKLTRILASDSPDSSDSKQPEAMAMDERIWKALSIIKREYADPMTLPQLSERVFMSECYFSDRFKQETGKSFSEYLTEYRIERACDLLARKELKIREVASLVGYSSSNYFSRVFNRVTQMSPGLYRRKMSADRKKML